MLFTMKFIVNIIDQSSCITGFEKGKAGLPCLQFFRSSGYTSSRHPQGFVWVICQYAIISWCDCGVLGIILIHNPNAELMKDIKSKTRQIFEMQLNFTILLSWFQNSHLPQFGILKTCLSLPIYWFKKRAQYLQNPINSKWLP